MNFKDYKKESMKNPSFRAEMGRYDLALEIGLLVLKERMKAGMTQGQLAKKLKTRQPSIARLENGEQLPSLKFLEKVFKVFKKEIRVSLTPSK